MRFLPIGLGYLQAALKGAGLPCRLANLSGKGRREILAYLRAQDPSVVGVSMFTFNRQRSGELLALAREACPRALLLAGGPHPTHLAREVFEDIPALDAIVKGEGEATLRELVQALAEGRDWRVPGLILPEGETASRPPVADLDALGLPAEHLEADFQEDPTQLSFLSTSRGCPATCSFCNTPEYWGSAMRFRSPATVMAELELLRAKHGLTYFSFRDDTFTARKGRILELMGRIADSGLHPLWNCQSRVNLVDEERLVAMKRAGCEFIQFGVEHASPAVLKALDKGVDVARARQAIACARKVGLGVGIYLITGIPGETAEDVEASVRFIRETHPQDVQVSPLAVYPGTQVWARLRAQGQVSPDYFRAAGDAEVFARVDAHTERALRRLEAEGEKAKRRAAYGPEDFAAQKAWLGYCAVTNLLCGEALEADGRMDDAEAQYAEIIAREPGSTWGFLKRALLRQRRGQRRPAREDLAEVLRLAPGNPEAEELRAAWG